MSGLFYGAPQATSLPSASGAGVPVPKGQRAFSLAGSAFIVDERYTVTHTLGLSRSGFVCAAVNVDSGENVAIKKISNVFANQFVIKSTLKELKLLKFLKHDNIVNILDVMIPRVPNMHDIYIVEELMETDLSRIIQSDQNLSVEHIQYFLFQVLSGLKYIHAAGVIHGDIKPEKLLVNSNCDTKITGFGLACPADGASSDSSSMTDFVSNRWYHAPELLLSSKEYTAAIDMWSVGCILAELFCRKPLFPGQNFLHQIHLIIEKLGSPSLDDIQFITSEKARDYVKSLSPDTEIELSSCFPEASLEALDLLDKLLQFNPARRISASEALKHPFLKNHYDLNEHEPGVPSFDFSFEDDKLSLQQLSNLLVDEVQRSTLLITP